MPDKNLAQLAAHAFPDNGVNVHRWWTYPGLRSLNLRMIFPMVTQFAAGFDGSLFGGLQALSSWQDFFGHPTGSRLASLGAAIIVGQFVASLTVSLLGDRFGRRKTLWLGALFVCIGGALQGAAQNYVMFGVSRAFIGLGSGWSGGVGALWVSENTHPKQRPTATALYNTSYAFGSIVAAWITFATYRLAGSAAWRIPSALQCVPAVFQLAFLWLTPESPRWLVSRGRNEEALTMLIKYHGEGNPDDPMVAWEYQEICAAVDSEKSLTQGWIAPLREAFTGSGNRKRMFIVLWFSICSQASGNSFISYYLSPVLASVGLTTDFEQTIINATSQILSWASAIAFAFLPGRVGRRPLFLISLAAMLAVDAGITAASAQFAADANNKSASYGVVALVYLFSPAYNLGMNGNGGLYITEVLPFQIRATGAAWQNFTGNCVSLIFQYATPIGLKNLGWKYFIIHVPIVIIEIIVVYFVFPETKGYSLEEIEMIFDGKKVVTPAAVENGVASQEDEKVAIEHLQMGEGRDESKSV